MEKKSERVYRQYPVGFPEGRAGTFGRHCDDIRALAAELGVSHEGCCTCGSASRKGCGHMGKSSVAAAPDEQVQEDPATGSAGSQPGRGTGAAEPGKQAFSKVPCEKSRGVRRQSEKPGANTIYDEISGWEAQGQMSIQRMCELTGVSRASFYRDWEQKAPGEAFETALQGRDTENGAGQSGIRDIRRIAPLLQRAGFVVGEEKVRLIMRNDNLLAVRRRRVRGDDRLQSSFPRTSEPGGVAGTERGQPALGSRHHLHSAAW